MRVRYTLKHLLRALVAMGALAFVGCEPIPLKVEVEAVVVPYGQGKFRTCFVARSSIDSRGVSVDCPVDLKDPGCTVKLDDTPSKLYGEVTGTGK